MLLANLITFVTSFYKKKTANDGFTLIELLVVIAIIGILSSVVLASLNSARERSRDARRQTDLNQIRLSMALLFDDCGTYPTSDGAVGSSSLSVSASNCDTGEAASLGDYMSQVPSDPSSGTYKYVEQTNGTSYCLMAEMEGDTTPDNDADCTSTDPGDGSGDLTGGGEGPVYSIQP